MSCVAEKNAVSQKKISVEVKKNDVGRSRPIAASENAIRNCMAIVHNRFVLKRSTNGLQNGFITHGR